MDVTVVVATFGAPKWRALAQRAVASLPREVTWIEAHGETLAEARNRGLASVESQWVCHLDADDELEPGFFEAMEAADGDLRAPAVRYVRRGNPLAPTIPRVAGHGHACEAACLRDGNWLVVGTVLRAALARDVGGWREYPVYEDWDLFQRCWLAGASIQPVPDAVYRAHVRRDSRNRAPDIAFKNHWHDEIRRTNMPELYPAAA